MLGLSLWLAAFSAAMPTPVELSRSLISSASGCWVPTTRLEMHELGLRNGRADRPGPLKRVDNCPTFVEQMRIGLFESRCPLLSRSEWRRFQARDFDFPILLEFLYRLKVFT